MKGPVGWFPDPNGGNGQRYFDGTEWTQNFAPHAAAVAPPVVAVAVANGGSSGGTHVVHLLLTLLTCGMWLPIWILCAIVEGLSSRPSTAVAVGGAPARPQMQPRPVAQPRQGAAVPGRGIAKVLGRAAAGIVGMFFALMVLGMLADYPVLLAVAVLALIVGGVFLWKHKAKERELRERELADAIAERADREHRLTLQGDPHGTYGRFPPPSI